MTSFIASFLALATGGIITSGYLVWQHYHRQRQPLLCPLNHDCSKVTESRWSHLFYVRNEVLGLLFYVGMITAALLLILDVPLPIQLQWWMRLAAGGGTLFSLVLVYLQVKVIKDYCFYCLISAVLTMLLFINSFFL
ncbi:vitamin K epoxide reductase family protein [Candidatus Woesearchaeota archaeon]|nr:vitamin K epoxide reductase family protein [Candidatus Woesearchaeota archaeon]